jgi:hypothetical protein
MSDLEKLVEVRGEFEETIQKRQLTSPFILRGFLGPVPGIPDPFLFNSSIPQSHAK